MSKKKDAKPKKDLPAGQIKDLTAQQNQKILPAWVIDPIDDFLRINCNFQSYCRHCRNDGTLNYMKLFMIKFLNFPIIPGGDKKDSYAFDMELRCAACGFHEPFGVAVSKEQYEQGLKVVEKNKTDESQRGC